MVNIIIIVIAATAPIYFPVLAGLFLRNRIRQRSTYDTLAKLYRGVAFLVCGFLLIYTLIGTLIRLISSSDQGVPDYLLPFGLLVAVCALITLPGELFLYICRRGRWKIEVAQ